MTGSSCCSIIWARTQLDPHPFLPASLTSCQLEIMTGFFDSYPRTTDVAEMQLRVAFDILADRVSSFEVTTAPRRFRSNFINGLKNLDVVLKPA